AEFVHETAAALAGLDADAVEVGAVRLMTDQAGVSVDGQIINVDVRNAPGGDAVGRTGAAVGLARDRHAVAGAEVIVGDGQVRTPVAALDRDHVVAGADRVAAYDAAVRDVGGAGIDVVGVAGPAGRQLEPGAVEP